MSVVEVKRGISPIILGFPHTGTEIPPDVHARLNENGQLLADTDWHIDQLYDGLLQDVTTVRATFHRYVIDANRDPAGVSLFRDKTPRPLFRKPILTASQFGGTEKSQHLPTPN